MNSQANAFVIGQGEVGRRLADALEQGGARVVRVSRTSGWEECRDPDREELRLLCMREHDLPDAYAALAPVGRERLVLLQNGFLEPVLGELTGVSRGLIWFTSKGEFFEELQESVFYGPAAEALIAALGDGGLTLRRLDDGDAATRAMIEKGLWNGVVGLPLGVHGLSLGDYLVERETEWRALIAEGAEAAGAYYGVSCPADEIARTLLRTTAKLGWVKSSPKALAWRNGALAWMGRRCGVPTPAHDRLLAAAGYDPETEPSALGSRP